VDRDDAMRASASRLFPTDVDEHDDVEKPT
jgi:hypothetical protein